MGCRLGHSQFHILFTKCVKSELLVSPRRRDRAAGARATGNDGTACCRSSLRARRLVAMQHLAISVPEAYVHSVTAAIRGNSAMSDALHSVTIFGSFVRGDFVPGRSDMDVFAVFCCTFDEAGHLAVQLADVLDDRQSQIGVSVKLVDLAWSLIDHLKDPFHAGFPFKFLTIYQQDFLDNHLVLYGEPVEPLIPRVKTHQLLSLVRWRAESMIRSLERVRGSAERCKLLAGEVAKLLAVHGSSSSAQGVSKREVLGALQQVGDAEATLIYDEYVHDKGEQRTSEFYAMFVESRLKVLLAATADSHPCGSKI